MIIETYIPGQPLNEAGKAVIQMMEGVAEGVSYADMIRLRLSGKVSEECKDTYIVAHENGVAMSRLWHGWGKHPNAIGNFGNFKTEDALQGKGIGKQMMAFWKDTIENEPEKPLALFCSSKERPLRMYQSFGFRPTEESKNGPIYRLYLPLGDSPETFEEFCQKYYRPAKYLIAKPATVEYRHEIDLLLNFALKNEGIGFGIGEFQKLEQALLYAPGTAQQLFTPEGRCVGWRIGEQKQVYPLYEELEIL